MGSSRRRSRSSLKPLLFVVAAVAGVLAVSLWSFWLTVRPPRLPVPGLPANYRLPAEDVTIVADDGVKLAAWFIPSSPPRAAADTPVVVLLHGYPANKADMLAIASALHPRFATLLVDFRYFGASEGGVTTLGHREHRDLRRVIDLLARRGHARIGVFGYSLGGAVALLGAAEDARIRAVVAWAPFADLRVLGRDVYRIFWVLKYPLVELMVLWGRLFLGIDITRPSPEAAAARLTIPVLIAASRDDEQIPFGHAERLQRALANNPRAEFDFGRGLHNERFENFERRLFDFFARHLS
ncbi:MAG: alpha/beta fold hydrolase [Candidatus Rokubacteria bacterium]|nr:alpha/beta fold hydrolase [Candidatus Rokubacteria bacterium]